RMRQYESALQLAESIQDWDVRLLALALVTVGCSTEDAPQGEAALNAMLDTMPNFTPQDHISTDTLTTVVGAVAVAGYNEEEITAYAVQIAQSVPEGDAGALWLLPSVLLELSTVLVSATLKERALTTIRERLKSADSLSSDPWQQMAVYGMGTI